MVYLVSWPLLVYSVIEVFILAQAQQFSEIGVRYLV